MCKLEPERFLTVRHIFPLLSFLLFSFLPPSLSPSPLPPFLSFFRSFFWLFESIPALSVRPSEQHGFARPTFSSASCWVPSYAPPASSPSAVPVLARCTGLLTALWQMVWPFLKCLGCCCGGQAASVTVTNHVIVDLVIYTRKVKVDLAEYFTGKLRKQLRLAEWFLGFSH